MLDQTQAKLHSNCVSSWECPRYPRFKVGASNAAPSLTAQPCQRRAPRHRLLPNSHGTISNSSNAGRHGPLHHLIITPFSRFKTHSFINKFMIKDLLRFMNWNALGVRCHLLELSFGAWCRRPRNSPDSYEENLGPRIRKLRP